MGMRSDTAESVRMKSQARGHSTPLEAGRFAAEIRAKNVVLNVRSHGFFLRSCVSFVFSFVLLVRTVHIRLRLTYFSLPFFFFFSLSSCR